MDRLTENKIILIVRRTRLDDLIARFNTEEQARFYVEHLGSDFSDYLIEHRRYKKSVSDVSRELEQLGRLQIVDRSYITNFLFGEKDTVVVLGQDGLVANTLKYLTMQPVVGVNPDPDRWDGILLPFSVADLRNVLPQVFTGACRIRNVTMAKVTLNTGEMLYGVNDLFLGPRSHTSIRYTITVGEQTEVQSSSGVIVSTGLGSTGWFRSVLSGAASITSSLSTQQLKLNCNDLMEWDSGHLYFSVREPWPSKTSSANISFGKITQNTPLHLVSHMPENGVIFSDGIESDYIQFNSGTQALITVAEKKGHLVIREK